MQLYLRNRMYDLETGRFTTEDPAKSGVNWYAYCEGNPTTKVDPLGLVSVIFVASDMADQAEAREEYYTKNMARYQLQ